VSAPDPHAGERACPCGTPLLRSNAKFCSSRCRQAAYRDRRAGPVTVSERAGQPARLMKSSALTANTPNEKTAAPRYGFRIVPDAKWPGMYRVRRLESTLTDMVNLTRAKDAIAEAQS
jgi:hypothetical protein